MVHNSMQLLGQIWMQINSLQFELGPSPIPALAIGEHIRFIKAYVSNQNPGYTKAVEIFSQSFSVTPSLRATEYQLAVKYSSI